MNNPVSSVLEADLRTILRRHGIVIWLDPGRQYLKFVERLLATRKNAQLPYDVIQYQDSYLELMLALEGMGAGVEKVPLLIYVPGYNETNIQETPLSELFAAGFPYQKDLAAWVGDAAVGPL